MGEYSDDLYLIGVPGRSLMIGMIPNDGRDPQMLVALTFGCIAKDVLLRKLDPGIYEINQFIEDAGMALPKLISTSPEEWEPLQQEDILIKLENVANAMEVEWQASNIKRKTKVVKRPRGAQLRRVENKRTRQKPKDAQGRRGRASR